MGAHDKTMHTKTMMSGKTGMALSTLLLTTTATFPLYAQDAADIILDEISVTATLSERGTKEVPTSITVISSERIDNEKMFNIKDAIQGTPGVQINSKNGGFDARLVIRGAGQKANYGVREIMVLRDGVPMTDPDSFTRFDFIDTQDIERIEITKGPGSIYGGGSAGGVIQILSKSVFETDNNRVRIGGGTSGTTNAHARVGAMAGDNDAFAVTVSRRAVENKWRRWNEFESTQGSVKHGHMFENGATWETEGSFSNVNMQLPGSMGDAEFSDFQSTGKQADTKDAWKFSGRDSNSYFFNSKYEYEDGDLTYKPRIYGTKWGHLHPITGAINDSPDNYVAGVDGEINYKHKLLGDSMLVAGVSLRMDKSIDAKKYQYRDFTTGGGGRISEVLSDQKGDLMESEDALHTQFGVFAQETVRPDDKSLVDVSLRFDRSEFDLSKNEITTYDYSSGTYVAGAGQVNVNKTFDLLSMRIGGSYAINNNTNLYASLAQSDQVPSNSEVESNTSLDASTTRTFEVGAKGRQAALRYDAAIYYTVISDEIVSVSENGQTTFSNAGEVEKKGFEFAGNYDITDQFSLGVNYAYSDFKFIKFNEPVSGVNQDRAGNALPYVPTHQYSLSMNYDSGWGLKGAVRTETWSAYQMDNANTEKYGGYRFITNANVGYDLNEDQSFSVNIENLFDKKYATEAKKDTRGIRSYSAGQPRTFVASYRQNF
ncbi:MAG: TonB-dependent receptor [Magnetovibrio sp.]|nr:TonB-dependent receptor [Magnetovibrio sp.]